METKPILVIDVLYKENNAYVAGVWFFRDKILGSLTFTMEIPDEYIPGQFYRRELPCIIELINRLGGIDFIKENFEMILVDGLFDLWDGKPGLGHHLWNWIGQDIEIIGIAKSKIREADKFAIPVLRGENVTNPLWVNGSNKERNFKEFVQDLPGEHRIPSAIKYVDELTRDLYERSNN